MFRLQLVYNVQAPLAAHNLVVWTYLFYTGTHFHADHATFRNDSLLLIIYKCTGALVRNS